MLLAKAGARDEIAVLISANYSYAISQRVRKRIEEAFGWM